MPTPADRAPPAPIPPGERSLALDVLRAVALFGIVVANVRMFTWVTPPGTASGVRVEDAYPGALDLATVAATRAVFIGQFNALFSFLFGLGFTLQMARIDSTGPGARRVYLRRLGGLLAIGVLHCVFLWSGDILTVYTLIGLFLLATRPLPDRALLVLALASMALAVAVAWIDLALTPAAARALVAAGRAAEEHQAQAAFAHGSFAEVTRVRAHTLVDIFVHWSAPTGVARISLEMTATALLGAIAGRRGLFVTRVPAPRSLRRALLATAVIGPFIAGAWTVGRASPTYTPLDVRLAVLHELQRPVLMTAYICVVALLLDRPRARRALSILAPVGRMPLTSYLAQSAILTTIFYGYGAGCYAKVGPAAGVLVACAIYAAQVVAAAAWFRRFDVGPVEWLWRRFTYGLRRGGARGL